MFRQQYQTLNTVTDGKLLTLNKSLDQQLRLLQTENVLRKRTNLAFDM